MARPAALFTCACCSGWHFSNGSKASPFQVHSTAHRNVLVCDGCGTTRPWLIEGEAIPVSVGRWPDLPAGLVVPADLVLVPPTEGAPE